MHTAYCIGMLSLCIASFEDCIPAILDMFPLLKDRSVESFDPIILCISVCQYTQIACVSTYHKYIAIHKAFRQCFT